MSHQPVVTQTTASPALHPWTALLLRARDGDRAAFAELVEAAQEGLFGFLFRKLRNRHLAEDLLADTFLKAWRTLPNYKAEPARATPGYS